MGRRPHRCLARVRTPLVTAMLQLNRPVTA